MLRTFQTNPKYPGIPTPEEIKMAVYQYVTGVQEFLFTDIYKAMVDHFELTDEQKRKTFSSADSVNPDGVGYQHVFYKHCHDTCKSLVDEGALKGRWPAG